MASRWSQVSASRAEIEVGRNPLRHGRRTRTKKSTVAVRHLCPNSSADGAIRLAGLRAFSALPIQITVSSTFPGILTYIWRVDWFQIKPKGSLGKPLAIAIGSYRSSTDRNWMLPPMGLANCKNDPAYPVAVEYRGDSTWDSDDFRFDTLASDAIPSSRTFTARKDPANPTNSKHEWLWILYELVRGKAGAKLARKPTSRHADRPNPKYYAQKTAAVASARLRLGESIPIDDPVVLLEGRRRLEFPLVLSRGRALKAYRLCTGGEAMIRTLCSCPSRTVLRTGRILTLHPWEGTVGKPASALGEPLFYPIDSVGRGSVGKPAYTCVNAGFGRSVADGAAR